MILPGRLRLTTLGDLLGVLHRERATGILEMTEASGRVHRLHVDAGLVHLVDSAVPAARIGDILKRRGFVDDSSLSSIVERLRRFPEFRLGEALLAAQLITTAELDIGLAAQRRERLERLFELDDARLAFRVPRGQRLRGAEPLGPDEFLRGRARARDRGQSPPPPAHRRRDPVRARALATLGLSDAADGLALRQAFRALASSCHPDRHPSIDEAGRAELVKRFAELSAAYHALVA